MNNLIAADMEGVSGIARWEETDPTLIKYDRFRRIMTDEANAKTTGAADTGADEFDFADRHGDGTNILIEEPDLRA